MYTVTGLAQGLALVLPAEGGRALGGEMPRVNVAKWDTDILIVVKVCEVWQECKRHTRDSGVGRRKARAFDYNGVIYICR